MAAGVLVAATLVILPLVGLLDSWLGLLDSACLLVGNGVVARRRRWPVATAIGFGVLMLVPELTRYRSTVNGPVSTPAVAATFLVAYALGSDCGWRRSLLGLVPLTACLATTVDGFNPIIEMVTIGPWLGGLVVASRRRVAEQLELRARELEDERELFAAQSVRYERARIARELHDIVAHCVSLMVVQANAGAHLTQADPQRAAEAFESISETARQADAEIARLVALLDTSTGPVAASGLRIVAELARRVQTTGLRVTCQFSGDIDSLPVQSAEAAYRLVQEAVTNAMKHAPGAPIEISIRGLDHDVELEVVNQPSAGTCSGLEDAGGGHGLAGMRERVARCGGSFGAGMTVTGGWRVAATLPRRLERVGVPVPR